MIAGYITSFLVFSFKFRTCFKGNLNKFLQTKKFS